MFRPLKLNSWMTWLAAAVLAAVLVMLWYWVFAYKISKPGLSGLYSTVPMSLADLTSRNLRILLTYDRLHVGRAYELQSEDIFPEKRVYGWDKSRTFSSSRTYLRQADVDTTTAELRQKIEAAGYKFFEEPYPNQVDKELHFKSNRGEYLRLRVSSKPRDDAIMAMARAGGELDFSKLGYREGPSNVVIKVNLDDNNE